jgi:hypothetical protein
MWFSRTDGRILLQIHDQLVVQLTPHPLAPLLLPQIHQFARILEMQSVAIRPKQTVKISKFAMQTIFLLCHGLEYTSIIGDIFSVKIETATYRHDFHVLIHRLDHFVQTAVVFDRRTRLHLQRGWRIELFVKKQSGSVEKITHMPDATTPLSLIKSVSPKHPHKYIHTVGVHVGVLWRSSCSACMYSTLA